MGKEVAGSQRVALGGDKYYDTWDFVHALRRWEVTRMWRRTGRTVPVPLTDARNAIRAIRSVSRNGNEWKRASAA